MDRSKKWFLPMSYGVHLPRNNVLRQMEMYEQDSLCFSSRILSCTPCYIHNQDLHSLLIEVLYVQKRFQAI